MYSDYFMPLNNQSFLREYGENKDIEINLIMQELNMKKQSNIYNISKESYSYRKIYY